MNGLDKLPVHVRSEELLHRDLLGGAGGVHYLQHRPDSRQAEEHVGGEVMMCMLQHEVASQGCLVPDPHTGNPAQVSGKGSPQGHSFANPGEEGNGLSDGHIAPQEHWVCGLNLQLRYIVDVDEGIIRLLVPLEDSSPRVPSNYPVLRLRCEAPQNLC